ncbi:MAG TPA: flagellar hook capping FlgD N-terminal domain-containing protein [Acetivibrio sp.]|uniref:flagellar hook capping FlgD N-terminal domain-containing protein n=1 Tax=Acetivibrio sp. TaxID=1872092 RepID=UPI002C0617A4|nr:flagellar hook capping FlgD N-terminal domain-containing protein [Acetivibrio sp.]HOM02060.1 flagellar hook capping FlgD N-terminal domain-containing protein [Acetivibrio sp.]
MAVDAVSNQNTIEEIIENTTKTSSKRNTGELGKDEFLNLLITQLQYQDPLNPVDDKEFISQMAQFSALEQMQNLNTSFSATKAFNMIGKYITGSTGDSTSGTSLVEGIVRSVKMQSGKTYLEVNGVDIPVENVLSVSDEYVQFNSSNISQYTGIIGYEVKGSVYDAKTGDIIAVSGIVREIQKGTYENYAVMDGVEVTITDINTEFDSEKPNYKKDYLAENIGNRVSVTITDAYGYGLQVPVTGVLREFNVAPDGKITGVLDGVYVPVDSIHNIKKPSANSSVADNTAENSQVEESQNEEPDSV